MGTTASYVYNLGSVPVPQNNPTYARLIKGTEEPGFSQHLVSIHNKDQNDFKSVPEPGLDTIWKLFKRQVNDKPDATWLGSRDFSQVDGPYVWKTWKEVDTVVHDYARGIQELNLMPKIQNDGEWRFMGILSKNRWEWTVTELASVRQSGTTVAFYDTLGPAAVEFIIRQTELTTISCAGSYVT